LNHHYRCKLWSEILHIHFSFHFSIILQHAVVFQQDLRRVLAMRRVAGVGQTAVLRIASPVQQRKRSRELNNTQDDMAMVMMMIVRTSPTNRRPGTTIDSTDRQTPLDSCSLGQ
jgi:hypothetical protein